MLDTTILSMVRKCDPDITNLNKQLKANTPEPQNKPFSFPTPENPGTIEDHTPIQTRNLKKLNELKEEVKPNPKDDTDSRVKFPEWFDWTDRLLTETKKQALEVFVVEYHDNFA